MRLRSLRELAKAVKDITRSRTIHVLGSSSLLASFPDLGEGAGPLSLTYDADFLLDPTSDEIAKLVGKKLGENSAFHIAHGYHADIVHPDITSTLPPAWEERLIPLEGFSGVFCLDPYDVAAVKVVVGRDKDISLVRALLETEKLEAEKLKARFRTMPLGERELFKASRNLVEIFEGRE